MKRFGLILAALLLGWSSLTAALTPKNITLAWDYPTNELSTNLTFRLYGSTNIVQPMTNWILLVTIPGTNLSTVLSVVPGEHFYALTASNVFWRLESDFSNVASTPPAPRSDVNLGVRLGP